MLLKTWNFSKRINSTKQPTGASRDYTVYLKENTSIERPVFILGTGIDAGISYCQAMGNYYFIDDIVHITAEQVELHCSLDVLATHKTEIGAYTCYVERAASSYNNMIRDTMISASQKIIAESTAITQLSASISSSGVYVIGVVGGYGSNTGGISTYVVDAAELEDALDFMFTDGTFPDILTDSVVKSFFNPFQYIVFLRWYPFTKAAFGTLTYDKIKFGWWETTTTYARLNDVRISFGVVLDIPTGYYNDFRSYDLNHTQINIDLPTVGNIQLDPSLISAPGIDVLLGVNVDIATGDTVVRLETVTGSGLTTRSLIGSYSGKMGASIPVGQVNGEAGSVISSALQTATGILSKDPARAIEGAVGVVGSYNPPPSMLGSYGSRAYFAGMTSCKVSVRCYETGDIPTLVYGRPLCRNVQLGTLTGYVQCSGASIELNAPDSETREVNAFLNGGFYYE